MKTKHALKSGDTVELLLGNHAKAIVLNLHRNNPEWAIVRRIGRKSRETIHVNLLKPEQGEGV